MQIQQLNPIAQAVERVIELTYCYELWWALVDRENQETFSPAYERYDHFFSTTIHSLLLSITVITYQLFETRPDTVSVNSLLGSLEATHSGLVAQIKSEIDQQKPVIAKVFALRNKVYAHRIKASAPEDVFRKVGVTPNQLKSVVVLAQRCVALLADAVGDHAERDLLEEFESRSSWANEDLLSLMQALNKNEH